MSQLEFLAITSELNTHIAEANTLGKFNSARDDRKRQLADVAQCLVRTLFPA